MKSPYMNALNLPAAGDEEPFMKKDMVIGTIGNTQGVRSIANPQRIASSMSPQMEPPSFSSSAAAIVVSSSGAAAPGTSSVENS